MTWRRPFLFFGSSSTLVKGKALPLRKSLKGQLLNSCSHKQEKSPRLPRRGEIPPAIPYKRTPPGRRGFRSRNKIDQAAAEHPGIVYGDDLRCNAERHGA